MYAFMYVFARDTIQHPIPKMYGVVYGTYRDAHGKEMKMVKIDFIASASTSYFFFMRLGRALSRKKKSNSVLRELYTL